MRLSVAYTSASGSNRDGEIIATLATIDLTDIHKTSCTVRRGGYIDLLPSTTVINRHSGHSGRTTCEKATKQQGD